MTAKTYSQLFTQTGLAGQKQMIVRVTNVSAGDTINFSTDLTKIQGAYYVGWTGASAQAKQVSAGDITGASLTTNAFASPATSFSADDVDILVWGPAATAS